MMSSRDDDIIKKVSTEVEVQPRWSRNQFSFENGVFCGFKKKKSERKYIPVTSFSFINPLKDAAVQRNDSHCGVEVEARGMGVAGRYSRYVQVGLV